MIISDLDERAQKFPANTSNTDSLGESPVLSYTQHSFFDAAEMMGVTDGQFEFLAHSGSLEIRDKNGVRVKSGFDPEKHHVPAWFVQNFSANKPDT
jgi:hypothetical protein